MGRAFSIAEDEAELEANEDEMGDVTDDLRAKAREALKSALGISENEEESEDEEISSEKKACFIAQEEMDADKALEALHASLSISNEECTTDLPKEQSSGVATSRAAADALQ